MRAARNYRQCLSESGLQKALCDGGQIGAIGSPTLICISIVKEVDLQKYSGVMCSPEMAR